MVTFKRFTTLDSLVTNFCKVTFLEQQPMEDNGIGTFYPCVKCALRGNLGKHVMSMVPTTNYLKSNPKTFLSHKLETAKITVFMLPRVNF